MRFKGRKLVSLLVMVLGLGTVFLTPAQEQGPTSGADDIEQLRLTPDQRQRIRQILEDTKDERQATNRRLREANVALDRALDQEVLDEALLEQRIIELGAAQIAQTRMRVQREVRIRRVLTPEQLATLQKLRVQMADIMGNQRPNQRPRADGLRPNQRNTIVPPLVPRRNVPIRPLRP